MPDIYRYEWTGKRTGYKYRLDLSEPSATAISGSPTVTTLNDDAIKAVEVGWEFDKIPLGMASPARPKLTFAVDRIPSALTAALLADPSTLSVTWNQDLSALYQQSTPLDVGMVAALYASDPVLSPTYKLVGLYVQDINTRVEPSLADDTVEVQFADAWQAAGKACSMEQVRDADWLWMQSGSAGYVPRTGAWSFIYSASSQPTGHGHITGGTDQYWFVTRNALWDRWELHVEAAMQLMTRRAVTLGQRAAMVLGMGTLREQKHTTDPTPSATTVSNPYVLPFIKGGPTLGPHTIAASLHDELARNYPCLYDVVADTIGQWCDVACIQYAGGAGTETATVKAWDPMTTNLSPSTVDWTESLRDAKPVKNGERITIAETSWEFAKAEDYDKLSSGTQGRNDNTRTVPVIWNWSPRASADVKQGSFVIRLEPSFISQATYDYEPPFFQFFYLSDAGGILSTTQMIRCASWWPGDGSSLPTLSHTWDWKDPAGSAIADQQVTGVMKQGADYALSLFGVVQWTMAGTVSSDLAMPWHNDRLAIDPYQSYEYEVTADLTSIRSWLSTAPVTWFVTAAAEDLIAETVEVTLYAA